MRPGPWLSFIQLNSDVYMRRGFRRVMRLRPHALVILGDMMDGGFISNAQQFATAYERYRRVFRQNFGPAVNVYHVPGNHDLGLHYSSDEEIARRYETTFGPVNYEVQIGKFSFAVINAPALTSTADKQYGPYKEAKQFLETLKKGAGSPRVLFSHIPLYRPPSETAACGPERTGPPFRHCFHWTYQCMLEQDVSAEVLEMTRPLHVFSGDDHHQCTYNHKFVTAPNKTEEVPEDTIGTFSWMQGNWHPSFALITLTLQPKPSVLVHRCYLPVVQYIYTYYVVLGLLTAVCLLPWPGLLLGYRRKPYYGINDDLSGSWSRMSVKPTLKQQVLRLLASLKYFTSVLACGVSFYLVLAILDISS